MKLLLTLFMFAAHVATTVSFATYHHWPTTLQMRTSPSSSTNLHMEVQVERMKSPVVNGVVARSGPLNEAVASILDVPLHQVNDLITLGAVWARMEALTDADVLALYDEEGSSKNTARSMYADLPRGWGSGEDGGEGNEGDVDDYIENIMNQRFRRILKPSWVEGGTDLRIYPIPRRFPSCYSMTRENSLLYEDTTFLVVDKPPMLPTQPDASNYDECCPGCVQNQLGPFTDITGEEVTRPLICHRVDACVGGCVVLSKDRNGQKVFQELQRDRKLRKIYLAVTTQPVATGMHVHWMWAPQSQRGVTGGPPCQLISHAIPESRRKARQFWQRCVLEVAKCEPIDMEKTDDYDPNGQQHYQCTIRLVTGRKHQVRAQLASLGAPIIRDTLYEPMAGMTLEALETDEEGMDERIAKCRAPTHPIGLQAAGVLFGGVKARAGPPWWMNRMNEGQGLKANADGSKDS